MVQVGAPAIAAAPAVPPLSWTPVPLQLHAENNLPPEAPLNGDDNDDAAEESFGPEAMSIAGRAGKKSAVITAADHVARAQGVTGDTVITISDPTVEGTEEQEQAAAAAAAAAEGGQGGGDVQGANAAWRGERREDFGPRAIVRRGAGVDSRRPRNSGSGSNHNSSGGSSGNSSSNNVTTTASSTTTTLDGNRTVPTVPPPPPPHRKQTDGSVIGAGVGGAVALLALFFLASLLTRRRKRQEYHSLSANFDMESMDFGGGVEAGAAADRDCDYRDAADAGPSGMRFGVL